MSRHKRPGSIGNRGKKGAAQPANAGTQSPKKTAGKKNAEQADTASEQQNTANKGFRIRCSVQWDA